MNTKHSIAVAIHDESRPGAVLLVQRPDDDEDLPGIWGLPAATLREGEAWAAAARRAGRDKLGLELEIGGLLGTGVQTRDDYELEMQVVEAFVADGEPDTDAPRPLGDRSTRYQAWRWAPAEALRPAAERGSLCSRIYLADAT